jgi:hypothetical protein
MSPEQKKLLRDALLAALVVTAPLTMPYARLKAAAREMGFRPEDAELEREIDYLHKRGFLTITADPMSAGIRRYGSTAAATDYCEAEGLV